jgi:glycosyltransferase involved in cell wall biosynthesis
MNILLVANYQPDRQESMQRVADLLEIELRQAGHQVQLIRPEPWVGRLKPGASGIGKWLGYIDKFLIFPQRLKSFLDWADVVHICDHSNAFYTPYLQGVPHVVSCNDLLAVRSALGEIPENPTRWSGRKLQELILAGLNRSQRVLCISEQTRQDVLRLTNLSPEAVSVVYLGLNYPYTPLDWNTARQQLTDLGIAPEVNYLLHVGGEHWYKNRFGTLQIFQGVRSLLGDNANVPDLHLVMAGAPLPEESQQWIAQQGLESRVILAVGVSNEDLRALYSAAEALVFPSLQEGFGWPILEAHACGCPVFTSDRAPMTEVGGEAAIYITPEDIQGSAATIVQHLPTLAASRLSNLENAQRFSNQKMIAGYLHNYELARQDFENRQNTTRSRS